jgi:hypothetical protein
MVAVAQRTALMLIILSQLDSKPNQASAVAIRTIDYHRVKWTFFSESILAN